MIAVLRGVLVEKRPNDAVVDAGGVGYEVHIQLRPTRNFPTRAAKSGCASTRTSVRIRWRCTVFSRRTKRICSRN